MTADSTNANQGGYPGEQPAGRALAIAYFSGRLSTQEHDAFEFRLLEDEAFSREIARLKEDLLEDYAAGSLPPAEQEALRAWVLASASRQEQVRLMQALRRRARTARWPGAFLWLAAAAACILAVSGLLLWRGSPHPSYRAAVQAPQRGPAHPPVQILLLAAERLRASAPVAPGLYTVEPATPLRIQVLLPHPVTGVFTLVVRADGRSVAPAAPIHIDGLTPIVSDGACYLQADLAAGSLPAGGYTATVSSAGDTYSMHFRVRLR